MKVISNKGLYILALAAAVTGLMAISTLPANAGNAYGQDNNPGKSKGHAVNAAAPASAANAHGKLTAAMGSLNAAHASPQAFRNANPRSRVGALAAYMEAMVAYEGKWLARQDVEEDIARLDAQITDLANQIAALDPEAEGYEEQKTALGEQIGALEAEKAELEDLQKNLSMDLASSVGNAAGHLKRAANKDRLIDASVVDAVNRLLDGKYAMFSYNDVIRQAEDAIVILINAK